jgi:hypothetical protein
MRCATAPTFVFGFHSALAAARVNQDPRKARVDAVAQDEIAPKLLRQLHFFFLAGAFFLVRTTRTALPWAVALPVPSEDSCPTSSIS